MSQATHFVTGMTTLPAQHPRCDCHECTQARWKMSNPLAASLSQWPTPVPACQHEYSHNDTTQGGWTCKKCGSWVAELL